MLYMYEKLFVIIQPRIIAQLFTFLSFYFFTFTIAFLLFYL